MSALINRDIPEPPRAVMEALQGIDFPTLGHFLEIGFVEPGIRRISGTERLIGRAVTVRMTGPDSALVHKATELLTPDDVLVVDTGGDARHASVGGVVASAVVAAGARGVVIDGVCTDVGTLRELGLCVYARGTSLLTTKMHGLKRGGAVNIPVVVGGVAVLPGYVVAGDENGLLIVDPARVAAVIPEARSADEREPTTLRRLREGEKLPNISVAGRLVAALEAEAG